MKVEIQWNFQNLNQKVKSNSKQPTLPQLLIFKPSFVLDLMPGIWEVLLESSIWCSDHILNFLFSSLRMIIGIVFHIDYELRIVTCKRNRINQLVSSTSFVLQTKFLGCRVCAGLSLKLICSLIRRIRVITLTCGSISNQHSIFGGLNTSSYT